LLRYGRVKVDGGRQGNYRTLGDIGHSVMEYVIYKHLPGFIAVNIVSQLVINSTAIKLKIVSGDNVTSYIYCSAQP
jgi:hypothetical protein